MGDRAFAEMAELLEPLSLLQPYSSAAGYGNSKVKEGMIVHVCGLVGPACDSSVKLVKKHVVPLLGQLLGDKKSKRECDLLCATLNEKLGREALLSAAASLPPQKKGLLEERVRATATV